MMVKRILVIAVTGITGAIGSAAFSGLVLLLAVPFIGLTKTAQMLLVMTPYLLLLGGLLGIGIGVVTAFATRRDADGLPEVGYLRRRIVAVGFLGLGGAELAAFLAGGAVFPWGIVVGIPAVFSIASLSSVWMRQLSRRLDFRHS